MLGGVALGLQPRPFDVGAAGERQLGDGIDLIGQTVGAAMAVDDAMLALAPTVTMSRTKTATGAPAAVRWTISSGRAGLAFLATSTTTPPLHEGRVERERGVVGIGEEPADALGRVGEHVGQRRHGDAVEPGKVGEVGAVGAVDHDQAGAVEPGQRVLAGELGQRGVVGAIGERRRVLHQRAQVGVFPLLDAAVRQAALLEQRDRRLAPAGDRRAARQAARRWRGIRRSAPLPPWCGWFSVQPSCRVAQAAAPANSA